MNDTIKNYTILNDWGDKFRFEVLKLDTKTSYCLYEIVDGEPEALYSAIDDQDDFKFLKKLGKNFRYFDINTLRLFLNMIAKVDAGLCDKFEIFIKDFDL